MMVIRVGDGTVPLAIVIYIDGSFVKHSIPVKPIYITLRNLDSVVSGKAMAWRVLGMLPSFKKSATPNETDEWRRQRRLDMHHACIKHVVDSINNLCEKDVHVQSITFVRRMCMWATLTTPAARGQSMLISN